MKKNDIRLYNVLFPIWFYLLFPQVWLIILSVNFLIDSLVLYFSAKQQGLENPKALWKDRILPVWGIGFLSDLIGAALVLCIYLMVAEIPWFVEILNPIRFPGTTLISLPGVILAGVMIYFLNKKLTFHESDLSPDQIHKLCLHLALWTAPYTMLIPLYG